MRQAPPCRARTESRAPSASHPCSPRGSDKKSRNRSGTGSPPTFLSDPSPSRYGLLDVPPACDERDTIAIPQLQHILIGPSSQPALFSSSSYSKATAVAHKPHDPPPPFSRRLERHINDDAISPPCSPTPDYPTTSRDPGGVYRAAAAAAATDSDPGGRPSATRLQRKDADQQERGSWSFGLRQDTYPGTINAFPATTHPVARARARRARNPAGANTTTTNTNPTTTNTNHAPTKAVVDGQRG